MPSVVAFDISDEPEDDFEPYTGPDPVRGYYPGVVARMEDTVSNSGKPMLKVLAKIVGGEYDGWVGWENILTQESNSKWKLAQFVRAVGFKEKGTIPALIKFATNKPIGIMTKMGVYEGQTRAEIARMVALQDEDGAKLATKRGRGAKAASEPEPAEEPEGEEETPEGEFEPYTEAELIEMEIDDLRSTAKRAEVWKRGMPRGKLVAGILKAQADGWEDEVEADESDEEAPF